MRFSQIGIVIRGNRIEVLDLDELALTFERELITKEQQLLSLQRSN